METRHHNGVTVIGLGPMGQAMAGAFLKQGYEVTVWNRTSSKADELAAQGAFKATTPEEALAANPLAILSLTDYDAMYAILESAQGGLNGKVIVNLSSDTPAKARQAATCWRVMGPCSSPVACRFRLPESEVRAHLPSTAAQ
ncbi:tartronate semialdehyde reductase [Paenibacillus sp. P1XP2]|nr:tartronate semialdehyde reductase [Paenibacillus sp. P1XP2]